MTERVITVNLNQTSSVQCPLVQTNEINLVISHVRSIVWFEVEVRNKEQWELENKQGWVAPQLINF